MTGDRLGAAERGSAPGRWRRWRRWIEPWYLAYAVLGATVAGIAPILLPLLVSRSAGIAHTGLVVAALNLGGLAAPLWGALADRYRLHRWIVAGGFLLVAMGLAVFAIVSSPLAWLGLALVLGVGAAAPATMANLFIVEAHPRAEWDERIGWLQTLYGAGQVGGLLLAGLFGTTDPRVGLLTAAGLGVAGLILAWFTTRTLLLVPGTGQALARVAWHGELPLTSPQHLVHHLTPDVVGQLRATLNSPFGHFLIIWSVSFASAAPLFALYPVLMQRAYGVGPPLSSAVFAVAAAIGIPLYGSAGGWAARMGALPVLQVGLGVRLVATLALAGLAAVSFQGRNWWALFAFATIVLAWSLLAVGGPALTVRLSPVGEGAGLGIFNAATALAGVVGATVGGSVAARWGYAAVSGMASAGLAIGLLLTLVVDSRERANYSS